MPSPIIQIYSSVECPYAYLATYRLMKVWPEYAGRVQLYWRALSLEYINRISFSKPVMDAERQLFAHIEPDLPFNPWPLADWQWPSTFWPAFEALACAQAQGELATNAFSQVLRRAFFVEGRNISLRHEVLALAEELAAEGYIYFPRFQHEWDTGRWKHTIVAECWKGWHALKLAGSATFVLPNGRQITNPAIGQAEFDEESLNLKSYTPFDGDPLDVYRSIFEEALNML